MCGCIGTHLCVYVEVRGQPQVLAVRQSYCWRQSVALAGSVTKYARLTGQLVSGDLTVSAPIFPSLGS